MSDEQGERGGGDLIHPSPTGDPGAPAGPGAQVRLHGDRARRSVMALALTTAALVALADWLFYGHNVGLTLSLFAAALVAGVWLVHPAAQRRRDRAALLITLAIAPLLLALLHDPGPLRVIVTALAILTLAMTCRLGWTDQPVRWAARWWRFLLEGWLRWGFDLAFARRAADRRGVRERRRPRVFTVHLGRWVVPVALSAVFVALFAAANPLIERWVNEAGSLLGRMPRLVELGRLMLWAIVGVWAWALLRSRPLRIKSQPRPIMIWDTATQKLVPATPAERAAYQPGLPPLPFAFSPESVVRCLILFNVVFAIETFADFAVVLSNGSALPAGVSYSSYAQRGSYPLVAAALLAAVFVLVTFSRSAVGPDWRTARRLVYLWLVQNLLLVLSAAWRLNIYVEAFHLTRWRIAAAIWMILVAAGLFSIVLRIVRGYDNRWLLRANAATLAAVLYACCLFNFDRLIADYNVAHARELGLGEKYADLRYLASLEHDAIGALERLAAESADTERALEARELAADLRFDLAARTAEWRGWTWNRAAVAASSPSPR